MMDIIKIFEWTKLEQIMPNGVSRIFPLTHNRMQFPSLTLVNSQRSSYPTWGPGWAYIRWGSQQCLTLPIPPSLTPRDVFLSEGTVGETESKLMSVDLWMPFKHVDCPRNRLILPEMAQMKATKVDLFVPWFSHNEYLVTAPWWPPSCDNSRWLLVGLNLY